MKPEVHDLKCWPESFDALRRGAKTVELRRNDRDYAERDVLLLREYDPEVDEYTGRHLLARVRHIVRDFDGPWLMEGYVALSLYRFREPRSI